MPAQVDWIIPGQVIYQRWWGYATAIEAQQVNEQVHEMFAEYPNSPLIHNIINAQGQQGAELKLHEIRKTYTILDDSRVGWIILIVDNIFLRFAANISLQINRKARIHFINSIDDWQSVLQERTSTIDWDKMKVDLISQFEANAKLY